jgi:diguanylate cyclase (GGDEF)-like protein/PAS domain S-box-containing protein
VATLQLFRFMRTRLVPRGAVLRSKLHTPLRRWLAAAAVLALAGPWVAFVLTRPQSTQPQAASADRALASSLASQTALAAQLQRIAQEQAHYQATTKASRAKDTKLPTRAATGALAAFNHGNAQLQSQLAAERARLSPASDDGLLIAVGSTALILLAGWGLMRSLSRADARMRALIDSAMDLVTIVDGGGGVRYHSPGITQMLGFQSDVQLGTPVTHLLHPNDASLMEASFRRIRSDGISKPIECRWRHADGSERWLETVFSNLLHDPKVHGIVLNSRDITERHKMSEGLRRRAFHDPLTGLANRARFEERLEQASGDGDTAVLFIDLDNFKTVNDSLGHGAGDRFLAEVARRLSACVRMGDMVARMGGDEFAVLIAGLDAQIRAPRIAERILRELAAPIEIHRRAITPSASIGIACADSVQSAQEILRDADLALYEAKRAGKGRAQLYRPVMHAAALEQLELETDMRLALERDEFVLYYQPLFRLEDGFLTGYEALMRWQHPTRGLLNPGTFIELAEQTGLIVPLTRWALYVACQQAAAWRQLSDDPLEVSVNLSLVNLKDYEILRDVSAALEASKIAPEELVLEITESTVMREHDMGREILHELKKLGVRLALDDFGTGYSSLSRLSELPFDSLKIPRPFIERISHNDADFALTQGIVDLGHHLDLSIVAEGIETPRQLASVRAIGCELAQGFHLATPAAPSQISPEYDRAVGLSIAPAAEPGTGKAGPLKLVKNS